MFYPLSTEEQQHWAAILSLPESEAAKRGVEQRVLQMSKKTYLAHCNRVSGPGSDCEP